MERWESLKTLMEICIPVAPLDFHAKLADEWTAVSPHSGSHSLLFKSSVQCVFDALKDEEVRRKLSEWLQTDVEDIHDLPFLKSLPNVVLAILEKTFSPDRPDKHEERLLVFTDPEGFGALLNGKDIAEKGSNELTQESIVELMVLFARRAFTAGFRFIGVFIYHEQLTEPILDRFLSSFNPLPGSPNWKLCEDGPEYEQDDQRKSNGGISRFYTNTEVPDKYKRKE